VARLDAFARAARGRAQEAEARRELALALAERQSADFEERRPAREARRAAELAPRSVEAQLLAASLEEDHARRRSHVEAALAAEPGNPRALAALAREELDQGRPHAAVRLLDRAVSAAPRWAAPRVDRVEALDRAGLEVRAVRVAAETADAFPTPPGAVRVAARAAARLSRVDDALARFRTLLALRLDDAEARGTLAHLLVERGDVAGAAALFTEGWGSIRDAEQRLRLADLLAANGHAAEAEAADAAALRIAPDDADALERRGRARLAAGRAKDALVDLQAALDRRPQSPELKELVRSLEPARERFEAPYLLDARALAAEARARRADDDAIVLGELKVSRVFPSGLSATFHQVVVKIVNDRGAEAFRRHVISWTPDRQDARVERVRIVKPDGTTVETHDATERSASEPWYRLYYDTRTRTLSFPALAKGDVLEIAWRIEDTAGENLLSDYFGDVTFLDDATRKARVDYVLLVPEARPIYSNAPDGVRHETRKLPGGLVEHRFVARDLGRILPEPGMPGWSEIARYVHVSTYGDWDQVARFYWGLVKDQLRPTDEVRATATRIVEAALGAGGAAARVTPAVAQAGARPAISPPQGGWTLEQKRAIVRGVYDFVVSQTRYVGLEFGIHGFKPYRVDQVLQRRFGDCKDKASLMHGLLESMGVESRLVLLRMRRLGAMPELPASLAIFNHAIAYVPDLDLWLDGTASHSGSATSRRGPRRDRAGREPRREGELRHDPAGAAGGQPGREPVRGDARGGRPRRRARKLARPRLRGAAVPSRIPRRARSPGAAGARLRTHVPGGRGDEPRRLRPDAHRGGRRDAVHARRAALRARGRERPPLHALRRRGRLRGVLRGALLPPLRPRPGRAGRHHVHVPLRAAEGLGAGRGARGRRRGHAARRVRGALPPRGGRARRRGACHVQDGAGRGGGVPRLPRPRRADRSRVRAEGPHRSGGRRGGLSMTTLPPRRVAVAAAPLALAAGCAVRAAGASAGLRDRARGRETLVLRNDAVAAQAGVSRARAPGQDPWAHLGAALLARRGSTPRRRSATSSRRPPPPRPTRSRSSRCAASELAEESPARAAGSRRASRRSRTPGASQGSPPTAPASPA
jgi:tetratricopeptide (TPR) repeat protein